MATNGISSSGMSVALAAAQSAMVKAADPRGEMASIETNVKGLETQNARFQRPAIDQAAITGLGAMANRQIRVGSGADIARAREAGGTIRNHLASASRELGALLNTAKTLLKRLEDYVFAHGSASPGTSTSHKPLGLETRTAGPRIE